MLHLFIQRVGDLFDRLDSDANHHRLERLVVAFSVAGFLLHLLLILLGTAGSGIGIRDPGRHWQEFSSCRLYTVQLHIVLRSSAVGDGASQIADQFHRQTIRNHFVDRCAASVQRYWLF